MGNKQEVPLWLLEERAYNLSLPLSKNKEDYISVIAFNISKTTIGIPIKELKEIVKVPLITWVPSVPPFVRGVFQLLDGPVAALDLGVLLGDPPLRGDLFALVISNEENKAALLTQSFRQYNFPAHKLGNIPEDLTLEVRKWGQGVIWIDEALIVVLDVVKFFANFKIHTSGGSLNAESH